MIWEKLSNTNADPETIKCCTSVSSLTVFTGIICDVCSGEKDLSSIFSLIVVLGTIQIFLKTITNGISRHHEKAADLHVKNIGYEKELSECFLLAAKSNLGNLYPHPLFEFFKFDHPSLSIRLSYLE